MYNSFEVALQQKRAAEQAVASEPPTKAKGAGVKVRRTGFRGRYAPPANVIAEAERLIQVQIDAGIIGTILADLHSAPYCGPGSGGDRGAYVLALSGDALAYYTIERGV